MAEAKILVQGVHKTFREPGKPPVEVLSNVDLAVRPGEFLCLLGPSGCGKSTLLNILGGFLTQDAGTISIDGQPTAGPDRRRVFVFQEYGIFPWMTVWDNIAFGLFDKSFAEKLKIVGHYIELVGLTGFEKTFPQQLSGGMRQRVAVARALAVKPDVIYMDEPLGALDSLTRLRMRSELLRIWREEKLTILFVTHDVEESVQLADRIVVFSPRPGRILETLTVTQAHPRDFTSPEYGAIKNRLYELLGVKHAV